MNELQKLTGGLRPYFITSADGAVVNKKFFLVLPCSDTVFTALESNTGQQMIDERVAMNIGTKTIPAGIPINCNGESYFTKIHVASGMICAYEAFV